jgi:large subunit ribosomal protein L13
MLPMKTYTPKPEDIDRQWWVVSAEGEVLGRLAARVAHVLRGKHKPMFSPHADCGDHVIVVNAEKIRLTGRKLTDKMYYSHSGYPGHLREANAKMMLAKHPEKVLQKAIRGMLPHNRLGRQMARKLKIYVGGEHPHEAQQPRQLPL